MKTYDSDPQRRPCESDEKYMQRMAYVGEHGDDYVIRRAASTNLILATIAEQACPRREITTLPVTGYDEQPVDTNPNVSEQLSFEIGATVAAGWHHTLARFSPASSAEVGIA